MWDCDEGLQESRIEGGELRFVIASDWRVGPRERRVCAGMSVWEVERRDWMEVKMSRFLEGNGG